MTAACLQWLDFLHPEVLELDHHRELLVEAADLGHTDTQVLYLCRQHCGEISLDSRNFHMSTDTETWVVV